MQQELLDHNERIKRLIPPEQLLVYEVSQGWDPLCEFLGVWVLYSFSDAACLTDLCMYEGQSQTDHFRT